MQMGWPGAWASRSAGRSGIGPKSSGRTDRPLAVRSPLLPYLEDDILYWPKYVGPVTILMGATFVAVQLLNFWMIDKTRNRNGSNRSAANCLCVHGLTIFADNGSEPGQRLGLPSIKTAPVPAL